MPKKGQKDDKSAKSSPKITLTSDDDALWEKAVTDVKPLKTQKNKEKSAVTASTAARAKPGAVSVTAKIDPKPRVRTSETPPGVGLDTRTDERLRRGQMPIEGRLDLHGMGQERARTALRDFLIGRQQSGCRCVLVITGKGTMKGGVLKQKVPDWLWEPPLRDLVLRHYPAKPQHGGSGAMYVRLRRNRD